jgi:hypothetical protein
MMEECVHELCLLWALCGKKEVIHIDIRLAEGGGWWVGVVWKYSISSKLCAVWSLNLWHSGVMEGVAGLDDGLSIGEVCACFCEGTEIRWA